MTTLTAYSSQVLYPYETNHRTRNIGIVFLQDLAKDKSSSTCFVETESDVMFLKNASYVFYTQYTVE